LISEEIFFFTKMPKYIQEERIFLMFAMHKSDGNVKAIQKKWKEEKHTANAPDQRIIEK